MAPNSGSNAARSAHVDLRHRTGHAEIGERGYAVALFGNAARHDAGEMRQIRRDVERKAVQRHPVPHADADRGDLVLGAFALVGPSHPNADAVVAAFAGDVEGGKRADDPFLDGGDEAAHIGRAPLEIEHHVADALAGTVIGELAAAAGAVDGKRASISSCGRADVPAV